MRILAVSGSLRDKSSNTILLRAAISLAPEEMSVILFENLGDLPHFNPDLDNENAPPPVFDWREQIKSAAGVLISSPEYAHGVPGSLKNALDWLVSSGETVDKPFALLNPSPRSVHAQAQLAEILKTMAVSIVEGSSVTVALAGKNLDEAGIMADPEISKTLREAMAKFGNAIKSQK